MKTDATHVTITGRVQGVWFRGWTVEQARSLGLSGWVRNRRDGSVEAVFSGDAATVREMIVRCNQGPPAARVDEVRSHACDDPNLSSFEARPTV